MLQKQKGVLTYDLEQAAYPLFGWPAARVAAAPIAPPLTLQTGFLTAAKGTTAANGTTATSGKKSKKKKQKQKKNKKKGGEAVPAAAAAAAGGGGGGGGGGVASK